jgi:hypothetical protein
VVFLLIAAGVAGWYAAFKAGDEMQQEIDAINARCAHIHAINEQRVAHGRAVWHPECHAFWPEP